MKPQWRKNPWVILAAIAACIMLLVGISPDELTKQQTSLFPGDWFYQQRAFPYGRVNHSAYVKAMQQAQAMRSMTAKRYSTGLWEFKGPLNTGGRLSDVEMHAEDPNTIFVGAASGGVFRSKDRGETWSSVFDDALSLSIGDIAIAPSNPEIIYVGTGEANAGGGSLAYDGVGVYRSEDGGESWTHTGLEESRNIGRMVVDPQDPEVVYVAAMGSLFSNDENRGIFKSSDGGQSWEKVLYISDSTGAIDVVLDPAHPDTIYAAMWERVRRPDRRSYGGATCGIYRSYDAGDTWTELTGGLPAAPSQKGRIGIDLCASDPEVLYAVYADRTGYFNGIFKSVDGGDTWVQTNDGSLSGAFASFGWWFGRVKVDPTDPENVFLIGLDIYRTQNGGNSWTNQSAGVHVDQHAVYIHPMDPELVLLGNDGGLYISENGGNTWDFVDLLPITQFYTSEVDFQFPERLYGGTQDNGTNRTLTGDEDDWHRIFGGDGFYVLVDPQNNSYVYAESQYGNLGRSTDGGSSFTYATQGISSSDRFNWCCPVAFDPQDPSVLFFGSNRLYRSANRAVSWSAVSGDLTAGPGSGNLAYHTLTTISVSPLDGDLIYTGSDDGKVHISVDGGENWEDISGGLPERWITRVVADPLDEQLAYVTVSGYRWDEYQPHVFRSTNQGQDWQDISSNLPEAPVNDLIVNMPDNDILFAATDAGVYVTYNAGGEWMPLGTNLPNVVVTDLTLHKPTNTLVCATYGRSMFSYRLEQDTLTGTASKRTKEKVTIYPNPFTGQLSIEVGGSEFIDRIQVFDRTGRLMMELNAQNGKSVSWNGTNREGQEVPAGIYMVCITMNDARYSYKVVKR